MKTKQTTPDERKEYYASDEWKVKRDGSLERAGRRCQLCNSSERLHVHHRTYANFRNELPGDLTVLCSGCHRMFHESRYVDVAARRHGEQMTILGFLRANPGMTVSDVIGGTGLRGQTVGQRLAAMRRKELVSRTNSKRWSITPLGEKEF